MAKEEPLHILLDSNHAARGKEALLSSQMGLLKSIKHIRNYSKLREQELKEQEGLKEMLSEIDSTLKEFNKTLPHVSKSDLKQVEKIKGEEKKEKKKQKKKEKKKKKQKQKKENENESLEQELNEVRKKLDRLGQ